MTTYIATPPIRIGKYKAKVELAGMKTWAEANLNERALKRFGADGFAKRMVEPLEVDYPQQEKNIHVALRDAIDAVTFDNVLQTLRIAHEAVGRALGRPPRIGVAGPRACRAGCPGRESPGSRSGDREKA